VRVRVRVRVRVCVLSKGIICLNLALDEWDLIIVVTNTGGHSVS